MTRFFYHNIGPLEKFFAACTFVTAVTHFLIGRYNFRNTPQKDKNAQRARNYWNWAAFQRAETGVTTLFFPYFFPLHILNQLGLAFYGLFCNWSISRSSLAQLPKEEALAASERGFSHAEAQVEANLRGKVPCSIQGPSGEVLAVNQAWFDLLKCPRRMGVANAWMVGIPKELRAGVRERWFSYVENTSKQDKPFVCKLPWICPNTKEKIGLFVTARPMANGCFASDLAEIDLRDVPSLAVP